MLIYVNDANFHYTECGIAELLQESWIIKRYMYINISNIKSKSKVFLNILLLQIKNNRITHKQEFI